MSKWKRKEVLGISTEMLKGIEAFEHYGPSQRHKWKKRLTRSRSPVGDPRDHKFHSKACNGNGTRSMLDWSGLFRSAEVLNPWRFKGAMYIHVLTGEQRLERIGTCVCLENCSFIFSRLENDDTESQAPCSIQMVDMLNVMI